MKIIEEQEDTPLFEELESGQTFLDWPLLFEKITSDQARILANVELDKIVHGTYGYTEPTEVIPVEITQLNYKIK